MPKRSKDFMRENEVADGINVIVDDRFVAMFPMECRAQVEHLIRSVNLAVDQKTYAASDLLEALQGVVAIADRKTVEFDRAHAAIAKALGR